MIKKVSLFLLSLFFFLSSAFAQSWYSWRYREHATDCTSLTNGRLHDLCYQQSDQSLYKCDSAACSTPTDWKIAAEPANANIQSHISDITTNPHNVTKTQIGLNTTDDLTQGLTNKYSNTTKEDNGQTAYDWGNHASAGYLTSTSINDTAYGNDWDTDTTHAPSKNAVYDKISNMTGTPGGNTTEVQFNDGGAFAGDPTFVFNKTSKVLSASSVSTTASDGSNKILMNNNSAISPTASSDEIYFEGNVLKVNENGTEKTLIDTANTIADLAASTSANLATVISDEVGTGKLTLDHHLRFTIVDPATTYTTSATIPIIPKLDNNITITNLEVTCDADPTTELTGDIKYADAYIGLANATVINDFDTTAGVRSDSTITNATVTLGKCVYGSFDATPDANITTINMDITYNY